MSAKYNPYERAEHQRIFVVSASILLLAVVLLVGVLFHPVKQAIFKGLALLDVVAFVIATLLLFRMVMFHFYGEQRRARAILGDPELLAQEQPVPEAAALPLPTTLRLHMYERITLPLVLAPLLMVFLIPIFVGLISGTNIQQHTSLAPPWYWLSTVSIIVFALAAMVFLTFLMYVALRWQVLYKIAVDEHGITTTYHRITSQIDWQDAHFFVLIDLKKNNPTRTYELSNEHTAVRWVCPPLRPRTPFATPKMLTAYAAYQRDTQALLSLVAAKTALPLYDLRAK